jgi:hypothetical protein
MVVCVTSAASGWGGGGGGGRALGWGRRRAQQRADDAGAVAEKGLLEGGYALPVKGVRVRGGVEGLGVLHAEEAGEEGEEGEADGREGVDVALAGEVDFVLGGPFWLLFGWLLLGMEESGAIGDVVGDGAGVFEAVD